MELLKKDLQLKTSQRKNTNETYIQQTQARELKNELLLKIKDILLNVCDVDIIRTGDGLVVLIPNNDYGVIPTTLDIKIKSLDFDYEVSQQEYIEKQNAKKEKKGE